MVSAKPPDEPRLAHVAAHIADASRARMLAHLLGGDYASAGWSRSSGRNTSSIGGPQTRRHAMTLCPIASAVGCKKCPVFSVCPVKGTIGDYKPADAASSKRAPPASATKKKP